MMPIIFLLLLFIAGISVFGWWHTIKPIPDGLNMRGGEYSVSAGQVQFLSDLTTVDAAGELVQEQQIFTTLFDLIDQAENYILIDFFLLNDHRGRVAGMAAKPLAGLLIKHLLARKQQLPDLVIDVVTDPVNSAYDGSHGGAQAVELNALRAAGINVVVTNLEPLRDSNPLYSVWWRLLLRLVPDRGHFLPHPFDADGSRISPASWLRLINFKANHRKVALVDRDGTLVSLVTSANPHGASRDHSNVALLVADNRLATDLYRSEQAVAEMSAGRLHPLPQMLNPIDVVEQQQLMIQLLTEARISDAVCAAIAKAGNGDRVRLAMFYLADRQVIAALLAAEGRGARVELILDPNRDAFGYRKNGVPNRPVAAELKEQSTDRIAIRWYQTHGEQFHTKLVLVEYANNDATLMLGSANLTRRNIDNYNLETNLLVTAALDTALMTTVNDYFDKLWNNRGYDYSVPYTTYADASRLKYLQYRLQEGLGLGTF
ncbi:MAG: hypothetical protein J7K75_07910 [Desulfuromonas sp.]|nr:hypothetical protein [Desulfuromonas sp.]